MYLHKDRETFKDMVGQADDSNGRTPAVVEKDYYVTLILKLLSEQLAECVFKGGTSLSKGFHVIDSFPLESHPELIFSTFRAATTYCATMYI